MKKIIKFNNQTKYNKMMKIYKTKKKTNIKALKIVLIKNTKMKKYKLIQKILIRMMIIITKKIVNLIQMIIMIKVNKLNKMIIKVKIKIMHIFMAVN